MVTHPEIWNVLNGKFGFAGLVPLSSESMANDKIQLLIDCTSDGVVRIMKVEVLFETKTDLQFIQIVRSNAFGSVLLLDGVIQVATSDDKLYHQSLLKPFATATSNSDKSGKRCLILGGGDGCLAREIFSINQANQITLVDYDNGLVSCFADENSLGQVFNTSEALTNDNLTYLPKFAEHFLANQECGEYEGIFVDLTDDWLDESGKKRAQSLLWSCQQVANKSKGIICAQLGPKGRWLQAGNNSDIASSVQSFFCEALSGRFHVSVDVVHIPSFGEDWVFGSFHSTG